MNDSQEHSEGHRAALFAGFLGWTLDAFDFFLVVVTLTAIAKEFHKTDKELALSIALTLGFRPVGAFIFGLLADRYGRRLPLMLDLVFYSVVEVLSGLAPNYATFMVLRALFGIGMGVGVASGRVCGRLSARSRLLLLCFSALGLAASVLHRRFARVAGSVRSFQSQRIRSLEENEARKLGTTGSQHRLTLEALHLSDDSVDDDELCFAWNSGHVSDVSRATMAL